VLELLKDQGQENVKVIIGGIIPDDDLPKLEKMGVAAMFGPGTNTQDIIRIVNKISVKKPDVAS
jgi:methylmalonyl-CoA mutase C-terminal domain/subunit